MAVRNEYCALKAAVKIIFFICPSPLAQSHGMCYNIGVRRNKEKKMTRKKLVELLSANYAEDEEVFVKYEDDQGICVDGIASVEDVTQTFCAGYYEVKVNGEWVNAKENGYKIFNFAREDIRWVNQGEYNVTKKCIVVD